MSLRYIFTIFHIGNRRLNNYISAPVLCSFHHKEQHVGPFPDPSTFILRRLLFRHAIDGSGHIHKISLSKRIEPLLYSFFFLRTYSITLPRLFRNRVSRNPGLRIPGIRSTPRSSLLPVGPGTGCTGCPDPPGARRADKRGPPGRTPAGHTGGLFLPLGNPRSPRAPRSSRPRKCQRAPGYGSVRERRPGIIMGKSAAGRKICGKCLFSVA